MFFIKSTKLKGGCFMWLPGGRSWRAGSGSEFRQQVPALRPVDQELKAEVSIT